MKHYSKRELVIKLVKLLKRHPAQVEHNRQRILAEQEWLDREIKRVEEEA